MTEMTKTTGEAINYDEVYARANALTTAKAAKLAAAYDAAAKGPVKIDWTRPTACLIDQTGKRNNTQVFQADMMQDALTLATAEADKIVAATGRYVGVFVLDDVRIPIVTPAQSMALAWKGGEA